MSLSLPTKGCTALMASMYEDSNHEPESRSPNSDEILPYVARTKLESAFEMKQPKSKTDSVAHGLFVRPLACSRFESSTSLSSGRRNSASLRRCGIVSWRSAARY